MAESDFQTELSRGLEERGGFSYKIPDIPFFIKKKMRFVPKKPMDCFWVHEGLFMAIECKQEKSLTFNMGDKSRFTPEQKEDLIAVEAAGGIGFLVIHFSVGLTERQARFRGTSIMDRAFGFRWRTLKRRLIAEALDSMQVDWCARAGIELPLFTVMRRDPQDKLIKERAWDPRPLLEI